MAELLKRIETMKQELKDVDQQLNSADEYAKLYSSYVCDAVNRIVQEIWEKHARKGARYIKDSQIKSFLKELLGIDVVPHEKF